MDILGFRPSFLPYALGVSLVTMAAAFLWIENRRRKYPPGPFPLPVIGSMRLGQGNLIDLLRKAHRAFGGIFTFHLGKKPIVILADYELIHAAFVCQADDCSSRGSGFSQLFGGGAENGLIFSPHWKEQRKFALSVLKQQGMGKTKMDDLILKEVDAYLNELSKAGSAPVNVEFHTHRSVANIICGLVLGSRFDYDNPVFMKLLKHFIKHTKYFTNARLVMEMPLLQKLPGDIFGYHQFMKDADEIAAYFTATIKEHTDSLDEKNLSGFIDSYILEIKKRSENGMATSFDDANCIASIIQLFVAGTDTTATTIRWAWLYMMLHPEVQTKVQAEIDKHMGTRSPSINDRDDMHYVEAVLTEVLRCASPAYTAVVHRADNDISSGGHVIPKGAAMNYFIAGVHMDQRNYPKPEEFKPERFIDGNGNFAKPRAFVPFGVGPRVCIGEILARAELFLFFTSVLQRFTLKVPTGSELSTEGIVAFIREPQPFSIKFLQR